MGEDHLGIPATTANVASKASSINASAAARVGLEVAAAMVTALKLFNVLHVHNPRLHPIMTDSPDRFLSRTVGFSITSKSKEGV
jgi:hypothetical protein